MGALVMEEYPMALVSKAPKVKLTSKQEQEVKELATKINTMWRKSAENFIEMGRFLRVAYRGKDTEGTGKFTKAQWNHLVNVELAFNVQLTNKLMKLGKPEVYPLFVKNMKHLPASLTTLDLLADFSKKDFLAGIKENDINPNMTADDAKELIEMTKPKPTVSREAEDAEFSDHVDTDSVEDDMDGADNDPAPSKSAKAAASNKPTTPAKTNVEQLLENFDSGIDSLNDYWGWLEPVLEAKNMTLSKETKQKVSNLSALLVNVLKNHC